MTWLLDLIPRQALLVVIAGLLAAVTFQTFQLSDARNDAAHFERVASDLRIEIAQANADAANKAAAMRQKVIEAQNEANKREAGLRDAAAAAAAESDGLRNDVDRLRAEIAGLSASAAADRAATVATVLAQCAARHQDLAERCDRHVSDIKKLTQGWPQ